MAFAVTKWAKSPDPRPADFSALGWGYGAQAPWQWLVKTTGALGLYTALNSGVLVVSTIQTPSDTRWQSAVIPPDSLEVDFGIKGENFPFGGPPTCTISMGRAILVPGELDAAASNEYTYPFALQVFTMQTTTQGGAPFAQIPNPITIEPVKWNV